ncbi:MAG: response regulator transcription factor [Acidobacteriia bacterium]|nr:response regulator transcription factor [Terriglobia bacterium]
MKATLPKKERLVRIAVIESDPLRFVGLCALLGSERELELIATTVGEFGSHQNVDVVLLGGRNRPDLFEVIDSLKKAHPGARIIVMGSGIDEETILKAIAAGAKGYVDEAAAAAEFVQSIQTVNHGSVWAPRRVLSMFIERATNSPGRIFPAGRATFTAREKEVLEMVAIGRSNKEIAAPLAIAERTVKAHVAKLMRKVGVQNRIALAVHAVTNSLVSVN